MRGFSKAHSWSVAAPGLGREPVSCRSVGARTEPQQGAGVRGFGRDAWLPAQLANPGLQTCLLMSLSQAGGRTRLPAAYKPPGLTGPEGFTLN